jgi:hypothetical protein
MYIESSEETVISKLDDFLLERADDYLAFCLDWFGLTKRQVVLIHVYITTIVSMIGIITYRHVFFTCAMTLISSFIVLMYHVAPQSTDRIQRIINAIIRSCFLFIFITPPHPHLFFDMSFAFYNVSFMAIDYLCASNHDGERGKKVKMAWSKIKELFGTSWAVEPMKIPT